MLRMFNFKVIVLHVGTNNITNSPEEIRDGILELLDVIREKHPDVYIVLPVSINKYQKFRFYWVLHKNMV